MEKKIVIHFNVPFTKPSPISCQDPLLHSIGAMVIQKTPNIISRRNSFEANYPSTTWHVLFGVPDVSVVPFLQLSPFFCVANEPPLHIHFPQNNPINLPRKAVPVALERNTQLESSGRG